MHFNSDGDKIITGSFDGTARIWDVATGENIHTLIGHQGELSCA
jgi:dynein assembly factor with WDR repeat domains 1